MAMKFLVTFVLLISIGEIYSKSLLEKIRDDSDLSQVSVGLNRFVSSGGPWRASEELVPFSSFEDCGKHEGEKYRKIFGFSLGALHNRKKKECCVI